MPVLIALKMLALLTFQCNQDRHDEYGVIKEQPLGGVEVLKCFPI